MDELTLARYQIVTDYLNNQTEQNWQVLLRRIKNLEDAMKTAPASSV